MASNYARESLEIRFPAQKIYSLSQVREAISSFDEGCKIRVTRYFRESGIKRADEYWITSAYVPFMVKHCMLDKGGKKLDAKKLEQMIVPELQTQ